MRSPQLFRALHAAGYGQLAGALPLLDADEMQHMVAALENARRYADSAVAGYFRKQLAAHAVTDGMRGPKETLPLGARSAEFAGWLYRDSAAGADQADRKRTTAGHRRRPPV